jgi:hypothetical protein
MLEKSDIFALYKRFSNFFPVKLEGGTLYSATSNIDALYFRGAYFSYHPNGFPVSNIPLIAKKDLILNEFVKKLLDLGYECDHYKLVVFHPETDKVSNINFDDIAEVFNGFQFRFYTLQDAVFFVCDPHLVIRAKGSVAELVTKGVRLSSLIGVAVADRATRRKIGYVIGEGSTQSHCTIQRFDREGTEQTVCADISIDPRVEIFQSIMRSLDRQYDFENLRRTLTFLNSKTSSRDRLLKTLDIVAVLNQKVFPLKFGDFVISVEKDPAVVQA